jgi:hypothetical protein
MNHKQQLSVVQEDVLVAKAHLGTSNASHKLLSKLVAWWLTIGSLMLLILTHGEEGSSSCRFRNSITQQKYLVVQLVQVQ